MSSFKELFSLVNVLELDVKKFDEKPSKTSGARLRASLLTIKKLCDTMRKDVLATVKAIPTKKSKSIDIPPKMPKLKRETTSSPISD